MTPALILAPAVVKVAAWFTPALVVAWWVERRVARAHAIRRHPANRGSFDAHVESAMALVNPPTVLITRRIVHPVFGPCEQMWVEPHPCVAAERFLREAVE